MKLNQNSNNNVFNGFYIAPRSNPDSTCYGFRHRAGNYNLLTNIKATGFTENITKQGGSNAYVNCNEVANNRSLMFTNDITEAVYHTIGDIVFNSNPTSGNPVMWVCTAAGSPGTMTPMFTLP